VSLCGRSRDGDGLIPHVDATRPVACRRAVLCNGKEMPMVRALGLFVILLLIGLFALLNWPAFAAPTPLSLGFTTVEAPLGFIMLGVIAFLSLLFTMWAISMQAAALSETRRQTRELQQQRDLADKAEASRFTELRSFLMTELVNVSQASDHAEAAFIARLDRMHEEMQRMLEQSTNSVAAVVGELEDRLERDRLPPRAEGRVDLAPVRR
jgi:uncharacterized integral membrane protein